MSRRDNQTFDIGQWCDYVRGLLDADTETQMQRHLDSLGLETATRDRGLVAALRHVSELAEAERAMSPPDWVVRSAKAIGSLLDRPDESKPSLWRRLAMSLSFDSLANPALVGVRDVQALDRHLVFDCDDYRVDLRVEPEADYQGSVIVGQLMRTGGDEVSPVADVPVLAVRDRSVLHQGKTGAFGEFQASGLPSANLGFRLLLEDDSCLEIEVGHNDPDGNYSGD
jgi:hypothetical protein